MTMLFLLLDILRQRFYDITLGVAIVKKFIFPVKARAMRAESVDFTYHSTIVFFPFFFFLIKSWKPSLWKIYSSEEMASKNWIGLSRLTNNIRIVFSTNMSLLRFTYRYMVADFHTLSVRKVRRRCKKNKKGLVLNFHVSKNVPFPLPVFMITIVYNKIDVKIINFPPSIVLSQANNQRINEVGENIIIIHLSFFVHQQLAGRLISGKNDDQLSFRYFVRNRFSSFPFNN